MTEFMAAMPAMPMPRPFPRPNPMQVDPKQHMFQDMLAGGAIDGSDTAPEPDMTDDAVAGASGDGWDDPSNPSFDPKGSPAISSIAGASGMGFPGWEPAMPMAAHSGCAAPGLKTHVTDAIATQGAVAGANGSGATSALSGVAALPAQSALTAQLMTLMTMLTQLIQALAAANQQQASTQIQPKTHV